MFKKPRNRSRGIGSATLCSLASIPWNGETTVKNSKQLACMTQQLACMMQQLACMTQQLACMTQQLACMTQQLACMKYVRSSEEYFEETSNKLFVKYMYNRGENCIKEIWHVINFCTSSCLDLELSIFAKIIDFYLMTPSLKPELRVRTWIRVSALF
jgi:hypothetical protein